MHVRLFCPARLIVVVLALSPLWLSAVPARQAVAAPPAVTVQPLLQRAQLDFDKKEYVAAMVLFTEATVLAPMNATAWAGKARSESFLDNDVAAVSDYSTAITLAPANATYRLRRGLSYNSLYDYDEAMRDFDAAIRLNPKLADAYYDRATIEDVRGDYMAAVADDTQGIRWNPAWWQGYMNRGESELSLQEWQASIADLTVYIQHTAKAACACAYYERGNAYFHLGEYAKAYSDHKQAITLGPVESEYYERLGADAYMVGRYEEGVSALTIAISADPSDALAFYYRGMARQAQGNNSGALSDLQEAVQIYAEQGDTVNEQIASAALRQLQPGTSTAGVTPTAVPATSPFGAVSPSPAGTVVTDVSPSATPVLG